MTFIKDVDGDHRQKNSFVLQVEVRRHMHPYYWVRTYFLLVFEKILVNFFSINKGKMLITYLSLSL